MRNFDVVVVGAGLCGLTAARELGRRGLQVAVLEKAERVGGRLAGIELHGAVFDVGAQFFTVRSPEFRAVVDEWMAAGIVHEWFRGMPTWPGGFKDDGYPRYRAAPSMATVAEFLAVGTEVWTSANIGRIEQDDKWRVMLEDGAEFRADWLISTPPVPEVRYQNLPVKEVTELKYDRCLALAVLLEGPSLIPEPGALQMEHEVLAWMADNFQKRISKRPGAMTLHANGPWSDAHHGESDEVIVKAMLEAGGSWLGAEVLAYRLRRWEYAKTVNPVSVGAREVPDRKLVLAGDSFAGAKMEGAVVSGLRAAGKVRG